MEVQKLSSNWKKLQASGKLTWNTPVKSTTTLNDLKPIGQGAAHGNLKRKSVEAPRQNHQKGSDRTRKRLCMMSDKQVDAKDLVAQKELNGEGPIRVEAPVTTDRINEGLAKGIDVGKYLGLDCEMVGVGPHPHLESALARVSLVDYNGEQVYDSYVKPQEEVTDWRTHVSGIQPKHMLYARSFEEVQTDIASLIKGRIVIGHSVRSDFDALFLDHPKRDIRDTARHPPYRKLAGGVSPKLKILVSELLGLDIQAGEHSSVEDARATMLLFRKDKEAFEREHIKKWGVVSVPKTADGEDTKANVAKKSRQKRKKKR